MIQVYFLSKSPYIKGNPVDSSQTSSSRFRTELSLLTQLAVIGTQKRKSSGIANISRIQNKTTQHVYHSPGITISPRPSIENGRAASAVGNRSYTERRGTDEWTELFMMKWNKNVNGKRVNPLKQNTNLYWCIK